MREHKKNEICQNYIYVQLMKTSSNICNIQNARPNRVLKLKTTRTLVYCILWKALFPGSIRTKLELQTQPCFTFMTEDDFS